MPDDLTTTVWSLIDLAGDLLASLIAYLVTMIIY